MRNNLLKTGLICCSTIFSLSCAQKPQERDFVKEAIELQSRIITLDTHADTPMLLWRKDYDPTKKNERACIDFPKMREGKLDMATFAIFTAQGPLNKEASDKVYDKALSTLDLIKKMVIQNSDSVMLVQKPEDIYEGNKKGMIMIFPSVENLYPMGTDITRIDTLYEKGIRMFGLCHTKVNDLCDSSTDDPIYGGLSQLGIDVVKKLNDLNAIIDVSHACDSTTIQVMRISKDPIVATHSSARSIASSARNFSDEMLDALKINGGVIQLCFLDAYTKDIPANEAFEKERQSLREQFRSNPTKIDSLRNEMEHLSDKYTDQRVFVSDFVDHIDYVTNRIGIDHVGIGSDFDGGGGVYDCKDASQFPNITAELIRRGYSENDIKKIWGENFIRVYKQVVQ